MYTVHKQTANAVDLSITFESTLSHYFGDSQEWIEPQHLVEMVFPSLFTSLIHTMASNYGEKGRRPKFNSRPAGALCHWHGVILTVIPKSPKMCRKSGTTCTLEAVPIWALELLWCCHSEFAHYSTLLQFNFQCSSRITSQFRRELKCSVMFNKSNACQKRPYLAIFKYPLTSSTEAFSDRLQNTKVWYSQILTKASF